MTHPDLVAALAAEHRQDLLRQAEARRMVTSGRPRLRWHLQSPIVRRPRPAAAPVGISPVARAVAIPRPLAGRP
ncbi:MAG: hypothetical protein ACRDZ8_09880 [Acidimicrobiales bacterium]